MQAQRRPSSRRDESLREIPRQKKHPRVSTGQHGVAVVELVIYKGEAAPTKAKPEGGPVPSEAYFESLLSTKSGTAQLARMINDRQFAPADLHLAAKMLGEKGEPMYAISALLSIINHENSLVREGAIEGLFDHTESANVRVALKAVAETDAVEALRHLAERALRA